ELELVDLGVAARLGQHDVRQAGDAHPAIQQDQADAGAEAERDQHVAGRLGCGELAHPDQRVAHDTPRRVSNSPAPPWSGERRNTIEQPSPSTIMLLSSSSASSLPAAREASTVSTSEPSMSVAVAGGDGSSARPVIPARAFR